MSGFWDETRTAEAIRLYKSGQSAAQIARALGAVSRNAVISILHRRGATGGIARATGRQKLGHLQNKLDDGTFGKPRIARPKKPKPSELAERRRVVAEADAAGRPRPPWNPPRSVSADIATAPRPWLTRRFGECAFPVDGEGADTRSCCNPSGAATYCPAHHAICLIPPPPRAPREHWQDFKGQKARAA